MYYTHSDTRADSVPVTVRHLRGESVVHINQRTPAVNGGPGVEPIDVYPFSSNAEVVISNEGTDTPRTQDKVRDSENWCAFVADRK